MEIGQKSDKNPNGIRKRNPKTAGNELKPETGMNKMCLNTKMGEQNENDKTDGKRTENERKKGGLALD